MRNVRGLHCKPVRTFSTYKNAHICLFYSRDIPKKCINHPRPPLWLAVKVGRNWELFGPRLAGGLKFRVKEVEGLHYQRGLFEQLIRLFQLLGNFAHCILM